MDSEVTDILAECSNSTEMTAKVFFPEYLTRPFTSGHRDMMALLDDDKLKRVIIEAPRGFGKTTILFKFFLTNRILFKHSNFILPVSHSAMHAVEQSENLKSEFEENPLLTKVCTALHTDYKTNNWARDRWRAASGTYIIPRGAGQQVRGALKRGDRPDLIMVDDLEDKEEVRTAENRKKMKDWFFNTLLKCVDIYQDQWRVCVSGTVLHEDSLLENLYDDKGWERIRIELCDDNFQSLYPEFVSTKKVLAIVDEYRRAGLLDGFYQEYRNLCIDTENAAFSSKYFQEYDEAELVQNNNLETVILVDPARTANPHAAETAIVAVGIDTKVGAIYVRDIFSDNIHPEQMYHEAIEMCRRYRSHVLGVETTGLAEFISYPFINAISQSGLHIEFVDLKAKGGYQADAKARRVATLIPFYRKGMVRHNKHCLGIKKLEGQLVAYPRSKKWDIMDAFSYVSEIMTKGERYFEHVEEDDPLTVEREFDALKREYREDHEQAYEWRLV